MKNFTIFVLGSILFYVPMASLFAQAMPYCGNSAAWEAQLSDPAQQERRQAIEAAIAEAMQGDAIALRSPIVIPVVVHVVWREPEENIDDARIWSQIERLNLDFNAENEDIDQVPDEFKPFVGNPGIRFCLAAEDPEGNPTNGIVRVQTTEQGIAMKRDQLFYSDRGGSNAWDPTRYLNIWTGSNDIPSALFSVTGYAYSPWTETSERSGIVIGIDYFGINDSRLGMGRLAVHEVGHYLGLRHIWGDDSPPTCNDDDGISDTPNQFFYNIICPSYPQHSCNGTSNMFMNYMDYVYDRCMMMFTKEQSQRMNAVLALYRPGLLNSTIPCVQKREQVFADAFTVFPNPARRTIHLDFAEQVAQPGEIMLYNINGRVVFREFFILRNEMEVALPELIPGMYFMRIGKSMRKIIVHP